MSYELAFIQALLTTIFLECFIAALLGGRLKLSPSPGYLRLIGFVALASALTLPYVWFVLPAFVKSGPTYVIVAELSVTVIEAAFYWFSLKLPLRTAVILSVAANAFSYLVGIIIF